MISVNELRPGMAIELDGELYVCIEYLHVKPGKGSAFVRTKLKGLKEGSVIDKTFRAGEKVIKAFLESKKMQYLYNSKHEYIFMDQDTYEQWHLIEEDFKQGVQFLKESMEADILFYQGKPIGVELPIFVELAITETDPGFKGDTVSGGTKPATLETGAIVQVPLFIEQGDVIKLDTRTGEYIERVRGKS